MWPRYSEWGVDQESLFLNFEASKLRSRIDNNLFKKESSHRVEVNKELLFSTWCSLKAILDNITNSELTSKRIRDSSQKSNRNNLSIISNGTKTALIHPDHWNSPVDSFQQKKKLPRTELGNELLRGRFLRSAFKEMSPRCNLTFTKESIIFSEIHYADLARYFERPTGGFLPRSPEYARRVVLVAEEKATKGDFVSTSVFCLRKWAFRSRLGSYLLEVNDIFSLFDKYTYVFRKLKLSAKSLLETLGLRWILLYDVNLE